MNPIGSRGASAVCGPALGSLVLLFFPKLRALSEEEQTRVRWEWVCIECPCPTPRGPLGPCLASNCKKLRKDKQKVTRMCPRGPISFQESPEHSLEGSLLGVCDQQQALSQAAAGILIFQINGFWLRRKILLGSRLFFEAPERGSLQERARGKGSFAKQINK